VETKIRHLDDTTKTNALRFIDSWSGDDAYRRFGSAGINGQQWLTNQLTQHQRPAFVAVSGDRVVGLLDHINASGATHFGIVVDSQSRKQGIATELLRALLTSTGIAGPIVADCDADNVAAVALLRKCRFSPAVEDGYQITWRYRS